MVEPEKLEHDILAVLEEAGEENLSALLNTVNSADAQGSRGEIDAFRTALTNLINRGLLTIANVRDQVAKRWISLPNEDALDLLLDLERFLRWSTADKLWVWEARSPRVEILLTGGGAAAARKVLSEDGWPEPD